MNIFPNKTLLALLLTPMCLSQIYRDVTIGYPNGGANWPLFIAMDGGYYKHYGLNVRLVFSPQPAGIALLLSNELQALNYSLAQMLRAASKDDSLVLLSSLANRGVFALMAGPHISRVEELRGKRIGIGQIGDATYGFTVAALSRVGISSRDVEWVPLGPSVSARAAALLSNRADAVLVTAPAFFDLENKGVRVLVNFAERPDIFISSSMVMRRSVLKRDPELPVLLAEAHAEAIRRFYSDKRFAIAAFLHYDRDAKEPDTGRMYDLYAKYNVFERIPYVLDAAVSETLVQQEDSRDVSSRGASVAQAKIDNSAIDQLVDRGFFERIFGVLIREEELDKSKRAFRAIRSQ